MSVAKALARGILIAGWLGSSARGGPMLVLGTFSNQPTPVVSASTGVIPGAVPSWNPAPLRLGYAEDSGSPPGPMNSPVPASQAPPPPPPPPAFTPPPPPAFTPPQAPSIAPQIPAIYDAFINLGTGLYPNAGTLTTGNALPWYMSRPVDALFGGIPDLQQRSDFDHAVIQRIGQTFRQSGIALALTDAPGAAAAHTISVVANTANGTDGQVIGMTYLGGNGFHFIDQTAKSAQSIDQLEWIVAHNVAHELMLAFGVPEVNDTSGNFVDARNASWRMMVDPNARFSTDATRDLLSKDFQSKGPATLLMGAQLLDSRPVPEPAALALWTLGAAAAALAVKVRSAKVGSRRTR